MLPLSPIKILVVDEHPLAVSSIRMMLSEQTDMQVIDAFASGKALLEGLETTLPHVLLLDVLLPDCTGNELASRISRLYPSV